MQHASRSNSLNKLTTLIISIKHKWFPICQRLLFRIDHSLLSHDCQLMSGEEKHNNNNNKPHSRICSFVMYGVVEPELSRNAVTKVFLKFYLKKSCDVNTTHIKSCDWASQWFQKCSFLQIYFTAAFIELMCSVFTMQSPFILLHIVLKINLQFNCRHRAN